MKKIEKGVVATGHPKVSEAGKTILEAGGNAFDAILASFFVACVCEPGLASLGGGGFLMAHDSEKKEDVAYDFFVQTPKSKKVKDLNFYSVMVDFGGATQEFHIGKGSMATPGAVKGVFKIHEELCSMSMEKIVEPAVKLAREGVKVNEMTGFVFEILSEIFKAEEESFNIFKSKSYKNKVLIEGEVLKNPDLADTLELLAREGEKVFTEGEIAQKLVKDSNEKGGYLRMDDLKDYEVKKRKPLEVFYRGNKFITNPPPSAGGILIAFALKVLEKFDFHKVAYQSSEHVEFLARAMESTDEMRKEKVDGHLYDKDIFDDVFTKETLEKSIAKITKKVNKLGGTTHMSVIDKDGNVASMTVSNGEGSGYVIPGTGIMMNNMLGEEDLNPRGFHQWKENERISSMMSPSILLGRGKEVALGSAGSNRIRSAILQTIVNVVDFDKEINKAVNDPRIHFENNKLNIEPGIEISEIDKLREKFDDVTIWNKRNLFFGGANCVIHDIHLDRFYGAGDVRRGGNAASCRKNYIFGYGPLIASQSHRRANKDVIPVRLKGYKRIWIDCSIAFNTSAVNLIRDDDFYCNGVIFEDLKNDFDKREFGYEKVKIDSDKLSYISENQKIPDGDFWVYISKEHELKHDNFIWQSYLDVILTGCLEYDKSFSKEFLDTTYNWSKILNDRENPVYARFIKNLTEKDTIDKLLEDFDKKVF